MAFSRPDLYNVTNNTLPGKLGSCFLRVRSNLELPWQYEQRSAQRSVVQSVPTCDEQLLAFRSKSQGTLGPKFSCERQGRKNSYTEIVNFIQIILSKKGLFKQAGSMRL